MLDFNNNENAVAIVCYPFPNLVANKNLCDELLMVASDARNAYDDLANLVIYQNDNEENESEEERNENLQLYLDDMMLKCCATVQAVVNMVAVVYGSPSAAQEAIGESMYNITQYYATKGFYGEVEDEQEENTLPEL